MKRRLIFIVLITVLLMNLTLSATATQEEQVRLSEMTEMECLEFVKSRGVQVPDDYGDETVWAPFVKETIIRVEQNPHHLFCYNYTVTQTFAQNIQKVVNEYYGITLYPDPCNNLAIQRLAAYTLQENTPLSAWDDSYYNYNCYVYAIREDDTDFRNPGYYYYSLKTSNEDDIGVFSLGLTLEEQANFIIHDLEKLGYVCIVSSNRCPLLGTLRENQYAICYRYGLSDYHFMRMDEEGWTHKPGWTIPLLYLHVPTVGRVWINEYVDEVGPGCGTYEYNSVIQFITYSNTHDYYYAYYENEMHRYWCLDCDEPEKYEACEYDYQCNGDGTHTKICIKCGNTTVLDCNYSYSTIDNYRHSKFCDICDHSEVENCDLHTEYSGSGAHATTCTYCDRLDFASCTGVLTHYEDETLGDAHKLACRDCGNDMGGTGEACTIDYVFVGTIDGVNHHARFCTECGYRKTANFSCVYVNSDYCRFCGTHKDRLQAVALHLQLP